MITGFLVFRNKLIYLIRQQKISKLMNKMFSNVLLYSPRALINYREIEKQIVKDIIREYFLV